MKISKFKYDSEKVVLVYLTKYEYDILEKSYIENIKKTYNKVSFIISGKNEFVAFAKDVTVDI